MKFNLEHKKTTIKSKKIAVRNFHLLNIQNFCKDIHKSKLSDMPFLCSQTSTDSMHLYNSTLSALLDHHCPLIEKTYKEKHSKSKWFNNSLQKLKQLKRQAERKFKKHQNAINKSIFNSARNKYNFELKQSRINFYKSSIVTCKKDPKTLYKTLNKLTGNVKEKIFPSCESANVVSEKMSSFYVDRIDNIRKEIMITTSSTSSTNTKRIIFQSQNKQNLDFTTFKKFNEIDIIKLKPLLLSMKNKHCQLDQLPTTLVKQCFTSLAPIIVHIINTSFRENSVPNKLKHALVTPIVKDKNGNIDDFKNYRPVSNLPFISKVLEKVAYCQINHHIESNKMHSKFQSAYRAYHSCETAMIKIVNDIQRSIHNNNAVALILLDSSAAFDTVDHDILLKKLSNTFLIKDKALEWIKSYLKNRTFSVRVNENVSQPKLLKYGVPQGSLLGPLFYILYTQELDNIISDHGLQGHMYADDCQIYIAFNTQSATQAEHKIEACLSNIKEWMNHNFLKLNPNKTNFIILNSKRNISNMPSISLKFNSCNVPPIDSVVSLGVNISNTLDFNKFISRKVQICSFHLRNLSHVKQSLPIETRIILVTNLILSNLDYCNALLIRATNKDIKPLQRVMNKAIRFIFNLRKRDHISQFSAKAHFLPIFYRIRFKICLMAFKIVNGMSPDYLADDVEMFQPTTKINLRDHYGRDEFMFKFPPFNENNTLLSQLILNWNALPYNIRTVESLEKFKVRLKTYFYRKAYPQHIGQDPL